MKRMLKIIGSILFWIFLIALFIGLVPDSVFDWANDLPFFLEALFIAVIGFLGFFFSVVCWGVLAEEISPIYADWKKREKDKKIAKEEAEWEKTERMYAEWKKAKERKDNA